MSFIKTTEVFETITFGGIGHLEEGWNMADSFKDKNIINIILLNIIICF